MANVYWNTKMLWKSLVKQMFKKMEHYSDSEIIQQVLSGNTAQFEAIIRRYNSALYKAGRAYNYNHHFSRLSLLNHSK